jgi:lysyl endopeptidase
MNKFIITLIVITCTLFQSVAQVKTNFNNKIRVTESGKFNKQYSSHRPYIISQRDINSLLKKEAEDTLLTKPFMIAEPIPVNIDLINESSWYEDDSFEYGKFTIIATGAKSISINFDKFFLPKGSELYVYSANGEMITGPVTENENNYYNTWGSWVYKGGLITIESKIPISNKSDLKLHIGNVAYGYKDLYEEVNDFGESSSCNINVLCDLGDGWENERNSVALILRGNGDALCSGALINNTCELNVPYLLSANHCFSSNENFSNLRFTFQAWSPTCNPTQNSSGTTFNGATLKARHFSTDFCLVELNQTPHGSLGLVYAGWSRNTSDISQTTIIHHPRGDIMKISRDNQPPIFSTHGDASTWKLVLDHGATDPGSSGSPYFDQNRRIIGQHKGINQNNSNECLNTNKFGGRFDLSWTGGGTNTTRLSNWLDPGNTGAITTNAKRIPFIYSPSSPICSVSNFVIENPPQGTITWSSSNPNGLSIDQSTGLATRQNNFNGGVTITANISGVCNSLITKSVWVGVPNPIADILKGSGAIAIGATVPFSIHDPNNMSTGPVTYDWDVGGGYFQWIDTYAWTTITEPYLVLYAGSRNACGSLGMTSRGWNVDNPDGCPPGEICEMSVYPNPSSDELTVSLASTENKSTITNVKLVDSNGTVVYSGAAAKNAKEIKIPVNDLKTGTYYLSITQGRSIKQQQIIIRH